MPADLDEIAQPGVRVRVRFAGRSVDGFLLDRLDRSDHPGELAPLHRVVSVERVLTPEIHALVDAVATRYAGTRADVLRLAIPPRHGRAENAASPAPVSVVPPTVAGDTWARYAHGNAFLTALAERRSPRAAWQALPGEDWPQRLAEAAATAAAAGAGVVLVVPDQRDLDRVLAACTALAGPDPVVALAAGLGPQARYRRWLAALRGSARIVVGTRSAVFAPVPDLGLIAIWDDGDPGYAEPRAPYPHTREVALLRAHATGAAFLAGGFARTAEVASLVASGWAHDLLAPRSVVRAAAPTITAPGDSDIALERDPRAAQDRIPAVAFATVRAALAADAPVLVQVPRRGYLPALACAKCRAPARCRRCHGPLALPAAGDAAAPTCRWCGIAEPNFRCAVCGSRILRAVAVGAARTAEELGRAFPGVPVVASGRPGGSTGAEELVVSDTIAEGAQLVVATIGAEPVAPTGYGAALLLDGWTLLGRADLRAAEQTLRRWMAAAALVRPAGAGGRVIVGADPGDPTVQALVRWDPAGHAAAQLAERVELAFPPAVRVAAIDGTARTIAALLEVAELPPGTEQLGPVPLPPGARKPFAADDGGSATAEPADIERTLLRVAKTSGPALAEALGAAVRARSARRDGGPLRVQIDPIDFG